MADFRGMLNRAIEEIGLKPDQTQLNRLVFYGNELKRWNRRINLTSIGDDEGIVRKHFIDSLLPFVWNLIEPGASVVDIGTGAGFPGLVLKIWEPSLRLTLVESASKKVSFLKFISAQMELTDVEVLAERAETIAEREEYREQFDLLTIRYVAELGKSIPYCVPLLRHRGRMVAYKWENVTEEIEKADRVLAKYRCRIACILMTSPGEFDRRRALVVIEKENG